MDQCSLLIVLVEKDGNLIKIPVEHACVRMCVCVCVRERERDREREADRKTDRQTDTDR